MFDFFAFLFFILIFFILVYKNIRLRIKVSSLTLEVLKAQLEKTIISEKLSETKDKNSDEIASEAFLKFVSDSRDWAYKYIDEVQESIDKFITDLEPEILYFDTYGDLMAAEPNYNSMKKISSSYKELKKLLPEDYGKLNT